MASSNVDREEWKRDALCRRRGPLDWIESPEGVRFMTDREWGDFISAVFFPERGKSNESQPLSQAICESCPVQKECLLYSFEIAESDWMAAYFPRGVWGGQSQRKREQTFATGDRKRRH